VKILVAEDNSALKTFDGVEYIYKKKNKGKPKYLISEKSKHIEHYTIGTPYLKIDHSIIIIKFF